jgi:glycosyl transferase, family 25
MRIVLISLPESVDRRRAAEAQFRDADLAFEFYAGINGETANQPLFAAIDNEAYLLNAGRLPSAGEIGCFASHRAVWEYCIRINEPLIILEDDVRLLDNFPAAVTAVSEFIEGCGFIRLQSLRNEPRNLVANSGSFKLYYCKKYPLGAAGYAISPAAARKLLASSTTLSAPADKYIKSVWEHDQPLYCLLPESIDLNEFSSGSTIAGRVRPKAGLMLRINRAIFKLSCAIRRARFNRHHA